MAGIHRAGTATGRTLLEVGMINLAVRLAKRAVGLNHVWPNLRIFPDDTFIVSFPKSGNTWVRFLVANLLNSNDLPNFANIDQLVPESEEVTARDLRKLPRPRIMKSHHAFQPRFPRVIYIVRDPRDVVLSQYYFYRKRRRIADDYPIEQFVSRFVAGLTSDYGSWGQNVASWLATRHRTLAFQLLRYEDLVADTTRELAKVASFLNIPTTPEQLAQAVERSSARQMRKMESADVNCSVTKNTRRDIPFVRSATTGEWKSGLPESCVTEVEHAWAPLMHWLGYATASIATTRVDDSLVAALLGNPLA